ncbi:MAG: CHASE2 domain-containing serine/threonine-protein kinase [Gammaproteobacteria bacterium]
MTGGLRKSLLKSDALIGALYALSFALVALFLAAPFFYSIEATAYDRALGFKPNVPDERIVVIDIDDKSVEYIGRFPFSRDVFARFFDTLAKGEPKIVASSVAFSEAQIDASADYLKQIKGSVDTLVADHQRRVTEGGDTTLDAPIRALEQQLTMAVAATNYDSLLAQSVANSGNVLLPLLFQETGLPTGREPALVPDVAAGSVITADTTLTVPFLKPTYPLPQIGVQSSGMGHLGLIPDRDGTVRDVALIADHRGVRYPSLALLTALRTLGLGVDDLSFDATAPSLSAGGLTLSTTHDGRLLNHFYTASSGQPFRVESFYDVFTELVPANTFRGKTVLLGTSASGVGDTQATPAGASTAPVMWLAHTVSSLLHQEYVTRPGAARSIELGVFALLALYIALLLPRLGAIKGALISAALLAGLLLAQFLLIVGASQWLHLMTPMLFLIGGHLVMTIKRFGVTERMKVQTDAASAESNRMLGLAFQSQGQLDMAFEKFRQCPLDDAIMEPLYNLALDFERKRQFNKAGAVYGRMALYDPDYRDLASRIKRSEALDQTLVIGNSGQSEAGTLVLDREGVQKPMLGRYVVERELGKGAMGTVYLGRDPKINRVVAIKTIAISQEFDENEVASVRERFFREAETAGRLNHPDIVTVYDAGEEHDLAYIAMEYLRGSHMSGYTKADNLLPEQQVVDLMARVADALSYAHAADVVHRDIKPANIMFDPESGDLKITDFGIARITSSSKTKTGIVLGTPSYMSPEQLAGKNVTGRSDLFSLGVTLYQLLAGQLPFRADSMATLMYKIANEEHIPLRAARPELPVCLETVVDKALCKDMAERYQSGAEMALDLRDCRAILAA